MSVEKAKGPEIFGASKEPDSARSTMRGEAIDHLSNQEVVGYAARLHAIRWSRTSSSLSKVHKTRPRFITKLGGTILRSFQFSVGGVQRRDAKY